MFISSNVFKWLKTSGLAALGGGVAGAFSAMVNPAEYHFPHDLGSGKLWRFFFMGAGLTFAALLVKSPLGQKAMQAYQDSQKQLEDSKTILDQTKADLKPGGKSQ